VGAWRDDKKHGHGTFTWVNGDSYAGAWRNGKKHGHGTHAWADGSSYEGAWHEDAARARHLHRLDRMVVTGALVQDLPTAGVLTEATGRRFTVTYAADCKMMEDQPTPATKVCACV